MVTVPFGGDVRFLAVAAHAYLADKGTPKTPDDLNRHRCIRQRLASGKPYRWEFARNAEELAIDVPGVLTLDHNGLMVEAAEAGLGIAFVPEPFARLALDEGRLVALLVEWSPAIPGLCLYYPGHRHVPPALRAFIEELRSVQRP
jgi:DNA-binding transcriptional LysR family regulator